MVRIKKKIFFLKPQDQASSTANVYVQRRVLKSVPTQSAQRKRQAWKFVLWIGFKGQIHSDYLRLGSANSGLWAKSGLSPVFTIKLYGNTARLILLHGTQGCFPQPMWSPGMRQRLWPQSLDCTTQPSLFLFLTHATSKLHMEKKKKKFSENPSFSPDLNLFPFPLPTINLKISPALPLLQISYFLRKCRAMVYLEVDFRWSSTFFFIVLYLFIVHFSINDTRILCVLSHT